MDERIAKLIARAGICSRREAEKLITQGRVTHNNKVIENPALKFSSIKGIAVDNKPLYIKQTKLWLYHKPVGVVVSHNDEKGRDTVFDHIPIKERVISVGRLDKNTSGLLLLTNDGELARKLELPTNNFKRVYLVRVYGTLNFSTFSLKLSKPLTIDGVTYRPIKAELIKSSANNHLISLTISEGKNREIRKIIEYFNLKISRLTRIQYGPFELGDLKVGHVVESKKFID